MEVPNSGLFVAHFRNLKTSRPVRRVATIIALCTASSLIAAEPLVVTSTGWQVLSVEKIWDGGKHNAFTDLIRFNGRWLCTFREGDDHVGGNGAARVLSSMNGEKWESIAHVTERGIDLRDPKFSITPDNRLMLVMGGSVYEGKTYKGRQPRVSFSVDGQTWTAPQRVMKEGDWLWRMTWHGGKAYGISYASAASKPSGEYAATLVESRDGLQFKELAKFQVPGRPNEGTIRFNTDGEAIALLRREAQDREAWIGSAKPPYREWKWRPAGMQVGGPNFLVLPNNRMVCGGRLYAASGAKTFVGSMNARVVPHVVLPSGGDTSYPGMVWHEDLLWFSYYSTHEGRTSIYLARLKLP